MEFESGGFALKCEKLNAFDQLHLSRKIAPIIPTLIPVIAKYYQLGQDGMVASLLTAKIADMAELIAPLCGVLADMKNEDVEHVLGLALSKVQVQTDANRNVWMPLWVPAGRMTSITELNDLGKLLPIAIRVITFNLGNFIDGLLTRRGEAGPTDNSGALSPAAKTG